MLYHFEVNTYQNGRNQTQNKMEEIKLCSKSSFLQDGGRIFITTKQMII